MIIRLYRIFFGYLRVRFYGDFKERILSLCAQNGIVLWGTRLTEKGIDSSISISDFRNLRIIARGKGARVHILKKRGVPFVVNRYKQRLGIPLGILLFFLILGIMSRFIWVIDINGNHKISDQKINSACQSIGITEGIAKDSIYPKVEREKLMLRLDGIAWASLNIEGSRLTVNVTETKEKDQENSEYTNLKASSDGIIEKMDIISGTSVVNVGQAVKKGDLLVSGIIETADGTRFVKSKGEVIAKSQTTKTFSEAYEQKHLIPTGEIKTKRILELFGFKIPLFLGEEKGQFKAKEKSTTANLFGVDLPIRIYEKEFAFQKEIEVKYSYEKLCEKLEKKLTELSKEAKIINKEIKTDENKVTMTVLIEREENIAVDDILLINAGN